MTRTRMRLFLNCAAVLTLTAGACSRKRDYALPPSVAAVENSYVDLQPGWNLQVVIPLLKTGALRSQLTVRSTGHDSFSIAAPDLSGYTTLQYAVMGKRGAGVRLQFLSAQTMIDGKNAPAETPPNLPVFLPRRTEHIRLIYLVRSSQADHNMAIVNSKRLEALNVFTDRLRKNQAVCESRNDIFCAWVPAGVAVRLNGP